MSKAGGHPGIGNLSNILGVYTGKGNLHGIKWVDLFKNKIINDLSGVRWILTMPWDVYKEPEPKERIINEKVLMINEIRTL
jgi:transaldolase